MNKILYVHTPKMNENGMNQLNFTKTFVELLSLMFVLAICLFFGGFLVEILKFPMPLGIIITFGISIIAIVIVIAAFEEEQYGIIAIL